MLIKRLAHLLKNSKLSQAEFESLTYRLSPQQERLFLHLSDHSETDTNTLRIACSISNISHVARHLNRKLINNGDARKVICLVKPHTNQFDDKGTLGYWLIVDGAANDSH